MSHAIEHEGHACDCRRRASEGNPTRLRSTKLMFVKTISTDGSSADRKVRLLDVPAAPATIVITQLPSSALTVAVCELFSRGKFERTTALPIGPKPPNDVATSEVVGCGLHDWLRMEAFLILHVADGFGNPSR